MTGPVLADLTPEQRAAAAHPSGPALVLAGAGAGKTRVLCRRLAWLVAGGARPDEIVALTFTREAAEELRLRAEALLGGSHETLRVRTFNSYALDLARVHGAERGLLPTAGVARAEDRTLMLLDRLDELDLRLHDLRGDPARTAADMIQRIDSCRDQLVTAEAYRRWAEEARRQAGSRAAEHGAALELEFARVYEAHDRWLAEAGLEDFGLTVMRALGVLRAHPDRLAAVRERARHVLVDEYQDTNHAQAELLHLVAGGAESLVAVGDDDQGIYRFRGASAKNIADFHRRHPGAVELRLETNHRSTQPVLDAAAAVVAPIADRAPKRIRALPGAAGPAPRFWRAPDPEGQARAVVDEIRRLAAEGVPLESQAVLMRAVRLEARPVAAALERAGIPHQVRGGIGLFERREVRVALAWLRAATDPTDAQAHLRVAAWAGGVPWEAAADAVTSAAAGDGPVGGALAASAREAGADGLARALEETGRAAAELPPADALRVALDRTGLRAEAIAAGGAEGAARLAGLAALERLAREIAAREPALDARGLSDRLAGLADIGFRGEGGAPAERTGVQVMTVHQAKGLEFDAVFVVGMTAAGFPGSDRGRVDIPDQLLPEALPRGRDAHVAESRRLAYVAMTRARRHLVLSTVAENEAGVPQIPSPFLEEAREAAGAEVEEVGAGPEGGLLDAIAERRRAFEDASLRAARALAEGAPDADALADAAASAARGLVEARADALRPPAPPPPPPAPAARPPAPGLDLTPSAVETYRTCPLRYRYLAVDRIPTRPSTAAAVGTAAHAALEAHYRPGGTGGDGAALVDRFARELRRARVADTAEGRQALARAGEALPAYHERMVRSRTRPVDVERPFTLALGPHRVRGRVDRVDAHPAGGFQLVDYKTGRPPRSPAPGDDLVLRLYLAGAREAWGIEPRGATLAHVLDGATRGVHPDAGELADAADEVREVADGIAARRFEPRTSWACRSCDFALLCPAQDR